MYKELIIPAIEMKDKASEYTKKVAEKNKAI